MSPVFTRSELKTLLAEWKKAYLAVSQGKSYTIGSRALTRQDVSTIRNQIAWLSDQLASLENSASGSLKRIQVRTVR